MESVELDSAGIVLGPLRLPLLISGRDAVVLELLDGGMMDVVL